MFQWVRQDLSNLGGVKMSLVASQDGYIFSQPAEPNIEKYAKASATMLRMFQISYYFCYFGRMDGVYFKIVCIYLNNTFVYVYNLTHVDSIVKFPQYLYTVTNCYILSFRI